ncbi:adenylate/guanylate cyclase domain-containing protein [Nitrosopumilus ureiphilus]|uniref:Adenylate/guanylate cyclase with integral membrane sensor n=1 Tax=Nitrosopumilus ureiphilus TaxID=1470067 RepID=A0A7D5M7Y7_9ARCH|nr:adenylate/guanylate cyclase domain-containing protein [Nitrosopumilus ureiphilus]QLH07147.1 adenylate/guanylate cyclase with integral membrane sensor [Nitrosopumilus ureiphilus]
MSKESLTNLMLKNSENILKQNIVSDDEHEEFHVSVLGSQKQLCVGIIDIVNSTKTVARLPQNKYSIYYEIFLNHMGKIIYHFNGKILKTLGDGILFYFPETVNSERIFGFLDCIESGFSMIESHEKLNQLLIVDSLPSINFRVSLDYGQVTMMKTSEWILDLLGPTINICAKINHSCEINSMIIGSDLYEQIKAIPEYKFEKTGNTSLGLKHDYQFYKVNRKKS